MQTTEEVDYFIPGDYKGCCKTHNLKQVLSFETKRRLDTLGSLHECPVRNSVVHISNNHLEVQKIT